VQDQLAAWSGAAHLMTGEHYLTVDGRIGVASDELQATMRYQINQDVHESLPTLSGNCVALCTYDPLVSQLDAASWRLLAHVVVSWRYHLASGQVAIEQAPAARVRSDAHALVPLAVQWTGQWRVTVAPLSTLDDAPTCQVAHSSLGTLFLTTSAPVDLNGFHWWTYASQTPADGCLIVIGHAPARPTGLAGDTLQLLYRCGILLAVNDATKRTFSQLPAVSPTEHALAQQLIQLSTASTLGTRIPINHIQSNGPGGQAPESGR
jgi:hypothetical protein